MKSASKLIAIVAMAMLWQSNLYAQEEGDTQEVSFSFEVFRSPQLVLPYRQAIISQDEAPTKMAVYLHGGTSRGDDNTSQMTEPGIDSIAQYLSNNNLNTVFIVPQCPADESWGGRLTEVIKNLIEDRKDAFSDIEDVYIFGGSMGGTGTWTLISKYPDLFSAAMPVAGNPSNCDASNVAKTPLFTVMGSDDRIMGIDAVSDFILLLEEQGAKCMFEVEEGWSHEDTCKKSYTESRLNWVFSNTQQSGDSGLNPVNKERGIAIETTYWTLSGMPIVSPARGFYIIRQKYADSSETSRICIK